MNETFDNVSTTLDTLHNVTSMRVVYPLMTKLYISGVTAATLVGGVGNVVVLLSLHVFQPKERKKQHISKAFWTNLALADLLMCAVVNPMGLIGVTQGQTLFLKYSLLCDIIASTCFISCVCSLLSLALVTLHHHVIIFNSWLTDLFEGHKYHGLLCLMCWVISIIAELPNFLISYFNEQQCMWGRAHNRSYTMFTCILLIATPLVFILISHVKIVAKVFREDRKARIDCYQNRELNVCTEGASMAGNVASPDKFVPRNAIVSPVTRSSMFASTNGSIVDIQELNTDVIDINGQSTNVGLNHPVVNTTDEGVDIQSSNESSRPAVITTAVHRARRLDTTLMVMAIAYLVCWIPVLVVNLADVSHQMPIVFLWVSFLAHCHAFVACIAYMMTNSHFIRAFKMRSGCSGATISPPE